MTKSRAVLKILKNYSWLILTLICFAPQILNGQNNIQKALSYFNDDQTDQAIEILDSMIKNDEETEEALYLRAYINLTLKKREAALRDYDLLLQLDPDHKGALTNRSLLLMEGEHYKSALDDLNKLIEQDPDDWRILYERGYCYGLMGKHKLAISDFSAVIKHEPKNADAYAQRGISKINELSNEGLIRPAPEQCKDACADLKKAQSLGDTTLVRMISLYCK